MDFLIGLAVGIIGGVLLEHTWQTSQHILAEQERPAPTLEHLEQLVANCYAEQLKTDLIAVQSRWN